MSAKSTTKIVISVKKHDFKKFIIQNYYLGLI